MPNAWASAAILGTVMASTLPASMLAPRVSVRSISARSPSRRRASYVSETTIVPMTAYDTSRGSNPNSRIFWRRRRRAMRLSGGLGALVR